MRFHFRSLAIIVFCCCSVAQTKPNPQALTNAADYTDAIAPGGLATIFGGVLSETSAGVATVPLPRTLGGVQVFVNAIAAPLLYVSPAQVNIQIPYEVSPGLATVVVSKGGIRSDPLTVSVQAASPAIFQDANQRAVAQNTDYTTNSTSTPAAGGSVLMLYATGLGAVAPSVPSGAAAPTSPLSSAVISPKATIAGVDAPVLFAGLTPEFVGLFQANIQLPQDLAPGDYPVTLTSADYTSAVAQASIVGTGTRAQPYVRPNSAVPLQQWTGDLTQLYIAGRNLTFPTNGLSQTRYGVWGQGAGVSTQFPDGRIFMFFGDTVTAYKANDGFWYDYQRNSCGESARGTCIGVDTVGFIPSAAGLSQCNALSRAVAALNSGQQLTAIDYGTCPVIQYITDPSHLTAQGMPKVAWTQDSSVTGLVGQEGVLNGRIPTGVFVSGTSLYAVYEAVTRKPNTAGTKYNLESILLKANQPTDGIGPTTPISWKRLYPWSLADLPTGSAAVVRGSSTVSASPGTFKNVWVNNPTVWEGIEINGSRYRITSISPDASVITLDHPVTDDSDQSAIFNVLPAQNTQPGKFMTIAPFLLDLETMNALGMQNLLPSALKGLPNVLFVIGSGYKWRSSNTFLLAMDPGKLDGSSNSGKGVADAWYLTSLSPSASSWVQGDESRAVPLLSNWQHRGVPDGGSPCVGEVSVRWVPLLKQFLMTYGQATCGGLYVRTATAPWGPWTYEQSIWLNTANQGWEGMIVHDPYSRTPDFNLQPVLYDGIQRCCVPMSQLNISPWGLPGNPFAPFLLPVQTDNGDNTIRAYMNVSTFDPYVVYLVAFDVRKPEKSASERLPKR
jgi:uncharacterized protein (TIGR03437 family)